MLKYILGLLKNLFNPAVSLFIKIDSESVVSRKAKVYGKTQVTKSTIGDYSYVGRYSRVVHAFDIYGKIPASSSSYGAVVNNTFSMMRFVLRKCQTIIMRVLPRKKLNTMGCNNDIVVSLTSFLKRLNTLWLTIESLKRQTIVPSKIVLYLINEEVSKEDLPQSLLKEIDDIFEIRFRSGKL